MDWLWDQNFIGDESNRVFFALRAEGGDTAAPLLELPSLATVLGGLG